MKETVVNAGVREVQVVVQQGKGKPRKTGIITVNCPIPEEGVSQR